MGAPQVLFGASGPPAADVAAPAAANGMAALVARNGAAAAAAPSQAPPPPPPGLCAADVTLVEGKEPPSGTPAPPPLIRHVPCYLCLPPTAHQRLRIVAFVMCIAPNTGVWQKAAECPRARREEKGVQMLR